MEAAADLLLQERDEARAALKRRDEYRERNPIGGPARMFDAIADRIRAGEPFYDVLADYGLTFVDGRQAQPVDNSPAGEDKGD